MATKVKLISETITPTLSGGTFTSHVHLGDSDQIRWGDSNDGTIHHDGSHFRLRSGTGNFNVQANDFHITDASNSAARFVVEHDGETRLYHNGSVKLTTNSTGATVTGTLVADEIKVNDSENIKLGTDNDLQLFFDGTNSFVHHTTSGGSLKLKYVNTDALIVDSSANVTIPGALTVTGNLTITGDINSYNVTDLDVSDKTITLGVGQIESNSGGSGIIIDGSNASILWDELNTTWDLNNSLAIRHTTAQIFIQSDDGQSAKIVFGDATDASRGGIEYTSTDDLVFSNNNSDEKMRIRYTGKVGIDTPNPQGKLTISNGGAEGFEFEPGVTNFSVANTNYIASYDRSASTYRDISFDLGGAATQAIRFKTGGYVGIGKANPLQPLNVHGRISSNLATADHYYGAWLDGNSTAGQDSFLGLGPWHNNAGYVKFFQSSSPDRLALYTTNTSDHITLQESGGNVGIGITSPTTALEVIGDIKIKEGSGYSNYALIDASEALLTLETYSVNTSSYPADIIFKPAGAEKMRITDDGKVGIGTSGSPSRKLHIGGTAPGDSIIRQDATSTGTNWEIGEREAGKWMIFEDDGDSIVATFMSTGKVLIGDTASHTDDLLQIETPASGGGHGIQIRRNDSNNDQGIGRIQFGNNTDTDLAKIQATTDGATDNARLTFHTQQSGGSLTERMRIENAGAVGIWTNSGKTDAEASLDIAASVGVGLRFSSTYNYGPNRDWQINTNNYGSSNWGGWSLEQSTSQQGTPSVARIGVHANGNVGINMGGDASTSLTDKNPATALHVGGDITVGSADAVGTSGTAAIRFQNDNERCRITSNYDSGGGGKLGFWTDSTGGTLLQRMYINNEGRKVTNNVNEYYERIYLSNGTAYTFDIDVKSIGASGQILEVFAGYTHYSTTYGAVLKQVWSQRSTGQSDVQLISSIVNHSTSQAGAWSFSYVDADTVRLSKSAGTYSGSGWGYILIRSPD